MPSRKAKSGRVPLLPGDVIKTHPRDGFWGCAVVLSLGGFAESPRVFCHIGVTPIVFQHDYEWPELEGLTLSILDFERHYRLGPGSYAIRRERAIGIYVAERSSTLPVIGRVDVTRVYSDRLTFEVGDATGGKYPLCGRIDDGLGYEAIVSWRAIHDPEGLARDRAQADATWERYRNEELAENRARRKRRRGGT